MKVLHIDPDEYYHQQLRLSLTPEAELISVRGAEAVFGLLDRHQPDLLVMELLLLDRHGHELLLQIKQHPRHAALPVVVFSHLTDLEDIAQALSAGATAFFVKGRHSLKELSEFLLNVTSPVADL